MGETREMSLKRIMLKFTYLFTEYPLKISGNFPNKQSYF